MDAAESSKKRKRDSDKKEKSRKRQSFEAPANGAKVKYHKMRDGLGPVIASSAGVSVPKNIHFTPYQKTLTNSRTRTLLHSSTHSRLDYLAQEEDTTASESLLRHYIGIYDPATSALDLVEAPKVVLRTTLRPTQDQLDEEAKEAEIQGMYALRETLQMEFGTKKAQKMISDRKLNAITALEKGEKPIQNAATDALTQAVLQSMATSSTAIPTREMQQSAVDDAKPRPKPHVDAKTFAEVYPLNELIPPKIMHALDVSDWITACQNSEALELHSRYVAKSISQLDPKATDESGTKFKIVRYIYALLEFFTACKTIRKGRKVPKKEELQTKMEGAGVTEPVTKFIRQEFSLNNELTKWHVDRLLTQICALSLHVDNFEVDSFTLKEDMRLEKQEVKTYFRELGCKVNDPTEKQKLTYGISKVEAGQHQIARLVLPPDFPKQRIMAQRKKK